MKVIYISGPFANVDLIHGVQENILVASRAALLCWEAGWAVICPHKNTAGFQHHHLPWERWIEGDLAILKRCDAIYMLQGWERSPGAKIELEYALDNGLEIHYACQGIPLPG